MPVALRLHLATATALLSLIWVWATVFSVAADGIGTARIATLRAVAESATSIAGAYEAQMRSGAMAEPAAKAAALAAIADPSGLRLFTTFVDTVRRQGAGVMPYLWPGPDRSSRWKNCPTCRASRPGHG